MSRAAHFAILAALLAACAAPQPQVIQTTVEVTRLVEVTRIVEATRLLEITSTPLAPTSSMATPTPAALQVKVQLGLFWESKAVGRVNVKSTNETGAAISSLEYHCTVTSQETGEVLADQTIVTEAIPAGETNVAWFPFTVRSEHTPGFFQAKCESGGIEPVSAQFFGPGNQTELPARPNKNGTTSCSGALQGYDRMVEAYLPVKAEYELGNASYDKLAGAYSSALMAYYIAVNACQ